MPRGRKVCVCLWAVCLVLGGMGAALGADFIVTPAIELKGQYLNNINNSPTLRQSDYILSARPSVDLSYNTEDTKFEGTLALLGLHYMQYSGLDRINQYYYLNGSHKVTPRLAVNFGAAFISDSTARQELEESGAVINRKLRNSVWASPGFTYFLTERLSTATEYAFRWVDYQSPQYQGHRSHRIVQSLNYLLTEKTTLIGRVTGAFSRYDSGNTIYALGPQVGFSYKYEEKWDFILLGGVNINRVETTTGVFSADNEAGFVTIQERERISRTVSPFITAGSNYRWETGRLGFNYSRSESANAFGNQSQYNRFRFDVNQDITSRLSLNVNPYFVTSAITNPGSDYNSNYIGTRQGLTYKLTERTSVGAHYGFAYRSVTGSRDYSYPINDVWLTLNYAYPIHYQY